MIDERLKDEATDYLFEAILLLETKEECYRFFQDLATVAEIKALAQRLEVARMLEENVTYSRIEELTGASSATISRVKRCLYYGADGYKTILAKMAQKKKREESKDKESNNEENNNEESNR
ncbi:MAG: TrpR-like protein YerC/YecD [Peptococcaceae bacterium]|nr:TrpR-like protein YerC/YecD [Peptococcaceae bacterium]